METELKVEMGVMVKVVLLRMRHNVDMVEMVVMADRVETLLKLNISLS